MRSQYEQFSSSVESAVNNNNNNNNNNIYNKNNNNNNNYNKVASSSSTTSMNLAVDSSNSCAIPYHARENSLPFSYGQITPKSTLTSAHNRTAGSYNMNNYNNNNNNNNNKIGVFGDSANKFHTNLDFDYLQLINTTYDRKRYLNNNNNNNKNNNNNTNIYNNIDNNNKQISLYHEKNYYSYNNTNNSNDYFIKSTDTIIANETANEMIKPQPRLTSPLLVRKTLKINNNNNNNYNNNNNNSNYNNNYNGNSTSTNTISNTYPYNYGNKNRINNHNNNEEYFSDLDINNYNNNVKSYVALNGTLNSTNNSYNSNNNNNNNNYNNNSLLRKTPTQRNYEEFEELLRERREKVYNEHGIIPITTTTATKSSKYLSSPTAASTNYTQRVSTPNTTLLSTTPKSQKYNYDFEFHINLNDNVNNNTINNKNNNDDDNDSGVGVAPTPPRRVYTLDRMQQQYLNRNNNNNNNVERNYHTISATQTNRSKTTTTRDAEGTTSLLQPYNAGAHFQSERPPLELDVGYKRHFEILQQQQQPTSSLSSTSSSQWPGYNSSKYSIHETTTYGNGNSAGYIGNQNQNNNINNNNSNNNNNNYMELNKRSWQQADIRRDLSPSPIYATSIKQQQQQQQQLSTTELRYDETDGTAFSPYKNTLTRPETPAFPITPRTPFGTSTPSLLRMQREQSEHDLYQTIARTRQNSIRSNLTNSEPQEVAAHLVKFAKDSSQYWYKPTLSREEAITLLLNSPPGTFIVRDSTTYKNAYGLVLRVAQPPPGAAATGKPDDLVRHFLIEPTTRGVRLKGCANEPVFTSLSALVYEHSINQLALPCLLRIPEHDIMPLRQEPTPAQRQLLTQGAACNVLWLFSCETESLTGEEAIRKAIRQMYAQKALPTPTEVHFKVSQQGITLTDNSRKIFFRKHYASDIISYCAIDPDHRLWTMQQQQHDDESQMKKTIFAFVARRSASSKDNQCHVFCDLAINQPASAIVSFVNKTLPTDQQRNYML